MSIKYNDIRGVKLFQRGLRIGDDGAIYKGPDKIYEGLRAGEKINLLKSAGSDLERKGHSNEGCLVTKGSGRMVLRWRDAEDEGRYIDIRGIKRKTGEVVLEIDYMPIIPIVYAEEHGLEIMVVRSNITKEIEHIAVIGKFVGINQKGQIVYLQNINKNKGEYDIIKEPMKLDEARDFYKKERIEYSTRELKAKVREIIKERPLILTTQVRTGNDRVTMKVTKILVSDGKLYCRGIMQDGSISKRDIGLPMSTLDFVVIEKE